MNCRASAIIVLELQRLNKKTGEYREQMDSGTYRMIQNCIIIKKDGETKGE